MNGSRTPKRQAIFTFGNIIVKEIIPWVRDNYNISTKSSESIIGEFSLGGLAAAYLGLKHSEVFGNVLSQSVSYSYCPKGYEIQCWLATQYEAIDKLPLKFYLNVGVIELKEQIIYTNVKLRNVLLKKGYTVDGEKL
ncbi:alpha/beta hydrolase [Clostridium estertheticum]|uniref:alpha/beta hydrolase n=1 Tax=Clostridium estertheticum TaxID=238834 RepID=UPI0013EE693B|nr:alpha/beta hydrolase-fold protein [Clostridium estertheticum]